MLIQFILKELLLWGVILAAAYAPQQGVANSGNYLQQNERQQAPRLRQQPHKQVTIDNQQEKITLQLHNVPIAEAFRTLVGFKAMNLLVGDDIDGNVTLELKDILWQDALDFLIEATKLQVRIEKQTLIVSRSLPQSSKENKAALQTILLPVRYASVSKLAQVLKSIDYHSRATIVADERSHTLIVSGTAEVLEQIKYLLRELDEPLPQILVEATIAVIDSKHTRNLGVRWGGRGDDGNHWSFGATGKGLRQNGDTTNVADQLLLDLPASGGVASLALGYVADHLLLDLELSALEETGYAQVISRPKIITGNRQQASIKSGSRVPYQEATSGGATAVRFEDATLKLEVTPSITPEGDIVMKLNINQDGLGSGSTNADATQAPIIETTELITEARVANGETLVLGGVFKLMDSHTKTSTPLLGNLPVVGGLFRSTQKQKIKTEMMIFITPHIIDNHSAGLDSMLW